MNYFNPFEMLVGRVGRVGTGDVLMEPGRPMYMPPAAVWPGTPARPTPYWPGSPGCDAPCYPLPDCPPQGPGFYGRAINSALASQGTQTALGLNSRDNTAVPAANVVLGAVVALTTVALSTSPTVPFCAVQYRVTRASTPFFDIMSIRAARVEYATDNGGIPADDFAADANSPPLQLPLLFPGTQITVTVRNNDAANHPYGSAFYGFPGPSCSPCL